MRPRSIAPTSLCSHDSFRSRVATAQGTFPHTRAPRQVASRRNPLEVELHVGVVWGHDDAPGAHSDVDRLAQRRQEVSHSRLPHPVTQVHHMATPHQQGIGLAERGNPALLLDAGQGGELQHPQRLPAQPAERALGLTADRPPCPARALRERIDRGRDDERARVCDRFAQQIDERPFDARIADAGGSEKKLHGPHGVLARCSSGRVDTF